MGDTIEHDHSGDGGIGGASSSAWPGRDRRALGHAGGRPPLLPLGRLTEAGGLGGELFFAQIDLGWVSLCRDAVAGVVGPGELVADHSRLRACAAEAEAALP